MGFFPYVALQTFIEKQKGDSTGRAWAFMYTVHIGEAAVRVVLVLT